MKVCTVSNYAGRLFNVKRVDPCEWYGSNPKTGRPCLQADEVLIEFWDASYSSHGPLGQFVARYKAETLRTRDQAYDLNLDGGVPEWWINATPLREALRHLGIWTYPASNDNFKEVDA
jgi:hypothetical protein